MVSRPCSPRIAAAETISAPLSAYVQQGYCIKLQYPVNIKNPDPKMAKIIISQLGGPDGELGASLRYLNQRFAMPYAEVKGLLTDIGTEESAHT
jgi:spore coat protein JC